MKVAADTYNYLILLLVWAFLLHTQHQDQKVVELVQEYWFSRVGLLKEV